MQAVRGMQQASAPNGGVRAPDPLGHKEPSERPLNLKAGGDRHGALAGRPWIYRTHISLLPFRNKTRANAAAVLKTKKARAIPATRLNIPSLGRKTAIPANQ